MSSSIAAAKRRRGVVEQTPPPTQQPVQRNQQQPPNPTSLTMEQAFQVIGKRLITLETFMKNKLAEDSSAAAPQQQQKSTVASTTMQIETVDSTGKVVQMSLKEMLEDFDKRYELLAEEVINIKNIVLELQAYTMSVNKTLYEKYVANDDINIPEDFVTEQDGDADGEADEEYSAGTSAGTDLITSLNKLNIKYGSAVYGGGYDKSKEMITGIIEM